MESPEKPSIFDKKAVKILVAAVFFYALCSTSLMILRVYSGSTVHSPIIANLFLRAADIELEDLSVAVDCVSNRAVNMTFELRNTDTVNTHIGQLYAVLYNQSNEEIAYGSASTGTMGPGVRYGHITLVFNWIGNYDLDDAATGTLTLTQTG